jgi:octaprenyl-diphosphate synthase
MNNRNTEYMPVNQTATVAGDMPSAADLSSPVTPLLQSLYEPIAEELARTEEILRDQLSSPDPYVDQLVKYGFRLGGKRLRPALLLLAAKACGKVTREHEVLAAVVEMIHTATLVHDDVLDEASMRRKLATVNSRWDNETSVLLGDFLFTHAFHLASTLPSNYACRTIGRSTNKVCEGELRQKGNRGDFRLSEETYYSIIQAKTAELCACSCELGAYFAEADDSLTRNMAAYGRHLGIAFQIVDDVLDIWGDEAATGKSLGTDLAKQKATLPLIRYLATLSSPQKRAVVLNMLENAEPEERRELLLPYLNKSDAKEYCRAVAQQHVDQATSLIESLPASPAKDVLAGLPHFVVHRSH